MLIWVQGWVIKGGGMADLHVNRWQRPGQDRLYVNLGGRGGPAVAWLDCRTGKVEIKMPEYEAAARELIGQWQRQEGRNPAPPVAPPTAPPAPPAHWPPAPAIPPLPPLTRENDLALNRPGAAVAAKVREIEGRRSPLVRLVAKGLRLSLGADDWQTGLEGERTVGAALKQLPSSGWRVLHAIQWPSGADIDHLAIGAAGVFTINAKHHAGARVWVGKNMIRVNNRSTDHLRFALDEAERVAKVLRHWCGWDVPVQPVIAVVGAANIDFTDDAPPVIVVDRHHLVGQLMSLPAAVPEHRISHVYEVARRNDVWMSTRNRRRNGR
ncbi:nuclease-related domain-containing protein [Actinacidiphila acididurans]|uniref:NERD domain-containing protein n=1 Tax=Actinacidiphila acididurans TaxID=2784346 RepID=A0ABS2U136_9ACTN|nr:nuclease-related domain-containing protein [Actinacidiphila acididurans]MBM9509312.1 NERD domain-containing protein [Actinacidiphila acididurans]